jgi:trehalose 6-phosphate phosphatase
VVLVDDGRLSTKLAKQVLGGVVESRGARGPAAGGGGGAPAPPAGRGPPPPSPRPRPPPAPRPGGGGRGGCGGGLEPLVDDPAAARLPDDLGAVLGGLAERLALVAVISGRPVSFIAGQLTHPRLRLVGLYGLEEWTGGEVRTDEEAAGWHDAVTAARDRLRQALEGEAGVEVEDKGLSVAVHWRNAADRSRAARLIRQLVAAVADDSGLDATPGKFVEELRPPASRDKGVVARGLLDGAALRAVAYVGDDRGDLPAFAVTRDLGGWALAVEHGEETPPEVLGAADAVLDGAEGVAGWLRALLERVSSR